MNLNDEVLAINELRRALDSGRPEAVAQTAMFNFWPLYSAHFNEFIDAVGTLPGTQLERYPPLRVFHPMTAVLARSVKPYKPMVYADDARSMPADQLDVFILSQMVAHRFSGDMSAALNYARRLEDRIQQMLSDSRQRPDGPLWFFHQQIGSTTLASGDTAKALSNLSIARQLGRLSRQPDAERLALGRIALSHTIRGSHDDAMLVLEDAVQLDYPTAAHVGSALATERTVAALVGVERLSSSVDTLVAALEPYDSAEFSWPFALLARSRALLAKHRPDDAFEVLRLANDAHTVQRDTFAADVIASESIKALCAKGDSSAAWSMADSPTASGPLSLLATIELALHDSRLDFAATKIHEALSDHSLTPGHRAEAIFLAGWLSILQGRDIDQTAASRLLRMSHNGNTRRIMAAMPRQLIQQVRAALPPAQAEEFDLVTVDLANVEAKPRPRLTPSELRVLIALPSHPTTASIATDFNLSANTIKSQLKSLYNKLGCTSRETAIQLASDHRFFDSENPDAYLQTVGLTTRV